MKYLALPSLGEAPTIDDAESVAEYLDGSVVVRIALGCTIDAIDESKGMVVPIGTATDGTYTWPLSLNYYVKTYSVSPPDELLEQVRNSDYRAPDVEDSVIEELRANPVVDEQPESSVLDRSNLPGEPVVESPFDL